MTPKNSDRDAGATRRFGTKPFTGRRFVSNGKVRIEWMEAGRRRSRTIGPDSPGTRAAADAEVERVLGALRADAGSEAPESSHDAGDGIPSVLEALRILALAILDAADNLIERVQRELHSERDQ